MVTFGVFSIPSRKQSLEAVLRRLPFSTVVSLDADCRGSWWNAKRTWEQMLKTDNSHYCLLAYDMWPCIDFTEVLDDALAAQPGEVVGLYNNCALAPRALANGLMWTSRTNGIKAPVLPKAELEAFLAWADQWKPEITSADGMLDAWLMSTKRVFLTPAVSLVDSIEAPSDKRPTVRPYEHMKGLNWKTAALFAGWTFESFWNLIDLPSGACEDVHERMYQLARNDYVYSRPGHIHEGSRS
jgi:hypothetical protein